MAQVLAEVSLAATKEILDSYPHQLSGGQQQRIALAMAFACRPELIVLDEPTTGLDVATQRHVLDTVRGLCSSYGVAAVYVTHDLAVIAEIADRVAVMYAGRLIELGTDQAPSSSRPAHPYTDGLLKAIPSPEVCHVLVGMEGQPPVPGRRPAGCFFEPRCPHAIAACSRGAAAHGRRQRRRTTRRAASAPRSSSSASTGVDALAASRPRCRSPPAASRSLVVEGLDGALRARSKSLRCRPHGARRRRASRSWASQARARRRWPAASPACTATGRGRCRSTAAS